MAVAAQHAVPAADTPRERFNRAMRFECPGQTLATLGGIWPSTLARWVDEGMPREWTELETDKIARTIATGGLIPFFDHGLPHDVSYANFLYYVQQLKQACGLRT